MDEGHEMIDTTVPADQHALVFVESGEQSFDLPTPPIAPEDPVVSRLGPAAVSPMGRDQRNTLSSETLIERIAVVGTIPDKSLGSSAAARSPVSARA